MKFEAEQKNLEETEDSGNMTRNKKSALVCTMEWFGKKALTPFFFNNSVYINQDYGKIFYSCSWSAMQILAVSDFFWAHWLVRKKFRNAGPFMNALIRCGY